MKVIIEIKSLKKQYSKTITIFYHTDIRIQFNRKIIPNKDIPIQYTSTKIEYKEQRVRILRESKKHLASNSTACNICIQIQKANNTGMEHISNFRSSTIS